MTTTPLKPWQDPATAIPPDAPCPTLIYEVWGVDPWDRGKGDVCLWVGESARFWIHRAVEHLKDKYWRHDIRTIKIRPEVYPTKAAAWKVEEALTHKLQPVHSWEYNRDNPWVVRNRQGVHRSLPRIPAHWSDPLPGTRATSEVVPAGATFMSPTKPMGWFGKIAWATFGWVFVAAAVWILAATNAPDGQPISAKDGAGLGAVAATLLYGGIGWAWSKMRAPKRTRKRR